MLGKGRWNLTRRLKGLVQNLARRAVSSSSNAIALREITKGATDHDPQIEGRLLRKEVIRVVCSEIQFK